jgi:hypothetical protein
MLELNYLDFIRQIADATLDRYLPVRTLIRPSELAERLVKDLDYPAFLAAEDSTAERPPT